MGASTTLGQIRDGLKTRLETIERLRVFDTLPDGVPVGIDGVALISPPQGEGQTVVEFDVLTDGIHRWYLRVRVLVGRTAERAGQDTLDAYLSPGTRSIKAAIEGDMTLGGIVGKTIIARAMNYGEIVVGTTRYLAVDWDLEVTT